MVYVFPYRRSLNEDPARMLELARDPDLLGIGGLGEEDVGVLRGPSAEAARTFEVWGGGSRPTIFRSDQGKVVPVAEIFQNRLDRGCKTEGPRAKNSTGCLPPGDCLFPPPAPPTQQFHHEKKVERPGAPETLTLDRRRAGSTFLLQFVTAAPNGPSIDVWHRLE